MRIMPMRMSDYDEVHALWKRTEHVGVSASDSREDIRRYLRRNPGLSLVARDGGKPATRRAGKLVGAIMCGHDGRRGFLNHLAIDADAQGRGLGKALVEKCLANLAKLRIRRCYIFVFTKNVGGRRFWKRIGWRSHTSFTFMSKDLIVKESKRPRC